MTDRQEPLTPKEEARWRSWLTSGHMPYGSDAVQGGRIARLLATLDAERAARQGAADTGWLVERGQPERQVPTVWWTGHDWTEDANKATRYASREDAERVIDGSFTPPPSKGAPSARAVEHRWLDTSYHARRVARRRQEAADTSGLHNRVRRIVERAANMGGCSQTHHEHLARDAAKVDAALSQEPTPDERPLDVELLARALANESDSATAEERSHGDLWSLLSERLRDEWRRRAERIAAEYARLSAAGE